MPRPTLQVDTSAPSSTFSLPAYADPSPATSLSVPPAYDTHSPLSSPVNFKKSSDAIPLISSPYSATPQQPDKTINNGPAPSVQLLFSLISRRQFFFFLLPAFISSVVAGGIAPFMTYVVGQSLDAFAQFPLTPNPPQSAKNKLLHEVGLAALQLVGLAAGSLAFSGVTSYLWIRTGEHNAMALRKIVYAAVMGKDMVWFDTKMAAEDNVTSVEDEQGPMGAGGLMTKFSRYAHVRFRLT